MRRLADRVQVVVQMKPPGGFQERGGVRGVPAGHLRGAEVRRLRHGGGDERELLSPQAGGREIGGVFRPKVGDVLEGGGEAGDLTIHKLMGPFRIPFDVFPFLERLEVGDYPPGVIFGNNIVQDKQM